MLRAILLALLLLFPAKADAFIRGGSSSNTLPQGFGVLPVGGGGYVTGHDMAADGTAVARTNTGGAYTRNSTGASWNNVVTATSLGSLVNTGSLITGVSEIQIAKSSTSTFYMMWRGFVLLSTNKGGSWTDTGLSQTTNDANAPNSGSMGPLIAVDPSNPDVVLAGSPGAGGSNGLYITSNGTHTPSATWNLISSGSVAKSSSYFLVAFDPSSAVTGGKTQGIYACSNGTGCYKSTDGGTTWSSIVASGPTAMQVLFVDKFGVVWVTDNSTGGIWQYKSGSWSHLITGSFYGGVAVDPSSASQGASHVYAVEYTGFVNYSADGGSTWSGKSTSGSCSTSDIPWLATACGTGATLYLNAGGNALFDPALTGKLWTGGGIGTFSTTPPTSSVTSTPIVWTSSTVLQETLVNTTILVPQGGSPNVFSWDRAGFKTAVGGAYPTAMTAFPTVSEIMGGWNADYAINSGSSPPLMVLLATNNNGGCGSCGYHDMASVSTNGGAAWTPIGSTSSTSNSFGTGSKTWTVQAGLGISTSDHIYLYKASDPSLFMEGTVSSYSGTTLTVTVNNNTGGASGPFTDWIVHNPPTEILTASPAGCIAVSDDTHWLWLGTSNVTHPYRTTDGGKSWASITIAGVPTSGTTGWGPFSFGPTNRQCAADKGTAGTFYLYNTAVPGFYRSTDNGANWTKMLSSTITGTGGGTIKAVPGQTGHLFFSEYVGGSDVKRTQDGGTTWTSVLDGANHFTNASAFCFGATFAGQSYPSIYIAGFNGGVYGIWRSKDNASTWSKITTYPGDVPQVIADCDGDKSTPGLVYFGTSGQGAFYGNVNWLLKRDIDPAANDNSPMWLEKAA